MSQSSSSAHKPRSRRNLKPPNGNFSLSPRNTSFTEAATNIPKTPIASPHEEPAFPLVSFLWTARGGASQWLILPLILMIASLFRWTTGFWGYSGFKSPPMHGDFEAQRHWMEITTQLPVSQWYFHDLEWWGLDYPPLTAYHSWLLGKIGSVINPSWFALHTSRGLDDATLKIYMRATVLISEYLVYIPALILLLDRVARSQRVSRWESSIALSAILMQPATLLIDHAHFQYNTVMLGCVVAAVSCIFAGKQRWACVFFVNALGFKQMALYYAPAIFAYLLGSCVFPRLDVPRLAGIAFVTLLSFGLLFAPLILGTLYDVYRGTAMPLPTLQPPLLALMPSSLTSRESPLYPILLQGTQIIHRIFPFARGLFEDKVANFWCALHTLHKLHRYPTELLTRASLALTLLSILPPCSAIFFRPSPPNLILALAGTAWGFFLFSFQVHEKSVLLPLLPTTLLLADNRYMQPSNRAFIVFANVLGSWTLFPLLKRDELRIPYFVLTLLWAWLMGVHRMLLAPFLGHFDTIGTSRVDGVTCLILGGFYVVMALWHIAEAVVEPPPGKKELWVVANVLVGCAGFALCYLWCIWALWRPILAEWGWVGPKVVQLQLKSKKR